MIPSMVRARRWIVAAAGVAILLAGCGGDDRGSSSQPGAGTATQARAASGPPQANEPLAAAVQRLQRAVAKGDCKPLAGLLLHSVVRGRGVTPTTPPTPRECRHVKEVRDVLRDFKPTKVQEYGPAGLVEGTGARVGRGTGGIRLVARHHGSWKAGFDAAYRPQIGYGPGSFDFAGNARRFVTVVATRDCDGFWRELNRGSRFVRGARGDKTTFCRQIPAGYREKDNGIADVATNPDATPQELGTTRDLGFYGLPLKSGRYLLLVVSGPISGIADAEPKEHANPSVVEFLTVRQPTG